MRILNLLSLGRLLSNFRNDVKGGVAILFGLSVLPFFLSIGLAIDYTTALNAKSKLDAAADAAALAGVRAAKIYLADNQRNGLSTEALATNAASIGKLEAKKFFESNLATIVLTHDITSDLSVNIAVSGRNVTSSVVYNADVKLAFGPLVLVNDFHLSNSSSASSGLPSYIDFYLLLDNSPSMGLAASPIEIDNMRAATRAAGQETCEFACHTVRADGSSDPDDNYAIARRNNIKLRVDVLAEATTALTTTAENTQRQFGINNLFRMGIYAFNTSVSVLSSTNKTDYSTDNGIITNLAQAGNTAATMDLAPYKNDGNYFLTDFTTAFSAMERVVSTPGDGTSAASPLKYVFFVTDGVQDLPQGAPTMTNPTYTQYDYWGHTLGPINPDTCASLKSRGIKVAVLYTTYYATAPGDSPLYDNNIALWNNDIPAKLSACASPGLFYTADSEGIKSSMNKMFNDAIKQARLTN